MESYSVIKTIGCVQTGRKLTPQFDLRRSGTRDGNRNLYTHTKLHTKCICTVYYTIGLYPHIYILACIVVVCVLHISDYTANDIVQMEARELLRNRNTGSWINQDEVNQVKRFDEFTTVDWVQDELRDHRLQLLKQKDKSSHSWRDWFLSVSLSWLGLGVVGVVIGSIAGCLNIITAWLASLRTGRCVNNFYLTKAFCCWGSNEETCPDWQPWFRFPAANYVMFIAISVLFSFTAALLVKIYAPKAAGSGISEIKCIVSGFAMKGFLGWPTLIIKSLCLPLAIGSGLSLGKEGPSVHYAVCVGNCIAKLIGNYRNRASKGREFLTAAAAAGVAVAFGSPMGGVVYSLEEISAVVHLSTIWKSYFCALVAVTTLAAFNPFRTGQLVMFEVTFDTNWQYFEIPLFIILGIFGGIYGILIPKYNIRVVSFRKNYLANFALREVFYLTFLTASFCYFNEFLRLDMTESMQILFRECSANADHPLCDPNSNKVKFIVSLLFATLARCCLTIITYGCKVPAGIFVPSMAAGATFGRAVGILFDLFYQKYPSFFLSCNKDEKCVIPGTYAFLGAAAALSGITDLTVTVVVIMFELTGAVRYIIPTMIVVAVTRAIMDRWGDKGIAEQMIIFNGMPLLDAKEEFHFGDSHVSSAMSTVVAVIPSNNLTLSGLRSLLSKTKYTVFPIIRSIVDPSIVGIIDREDINYFLNHHEGNELSNLSAKCNFLSENPTGSELNFAPYVNFAPIVIQSTTSMSYTTDLFVKIGPSYILVEEDGKLAGILSKKDILRFEYSFHDHTPSHHRPNVALEAKVWKLMHYTNRSFWRNMGKLFFNNDAKFWSEN